MLTIVLRHFRPNPDTHIPVRLWGATLGRSPHEAIFLQDAVVWTW